MNVKSYMSLCLTILIWLIKMVHNKLIIGWYATKSVSTA